MQTKVSRLRLTPAFALPAVLIISSGVLILLLALMTIVQLERTTSKARVGSYQADLAVESGLEEAKMILAGVTTSDSFAIASIPFAAEFDDDGDGVISSDEDGILDPDNGERGRPYLYAIQGVFDAGNEPAFRLTPLFATHEGPGSERVRTDGELTLPEDPGLSLQSDNELDNRTAIAGVPHIQPPVTAWRTIRDREGRPVARYSYWVEDLQGYIDPEYVPGNDRREGHARANEVWDDESIWNADLQGLVADYRDAGGEIPLWPAPGLNPGYREQTDGSLNPENRLLNEVAVHTLDRNTPGVSDESQFDDTMTDLAPLAITPASLLALSGIEAPIERIPAGVDRGRLPLSDGENAIEDRWVEELFMTGNRPWEEQALVPFTPGLAAEVMGSPKLNLNRLLRDATALGSEDDQTAGEATVNEMAAFIETALPDFANERQGGFLEDYNKTLAASALDYADLDSVPRAQEGVYRGIDSHPLITEYALTMTFEWTAHPDDEPSGFENEWIFRTDNDTYLLFTVEHFAELWNMSNHPIEGTVQFRYENEYAMNVLFEEVAFNGEVLDNQGGPTSGRSWSIHSLVRDNDEDAYYSAPQTITLQPNEYRLVRTGAVRMGLRVGDRSAFIPPNNRGEPVVNSIREANDNPGYRMKWNEVVVDRTGAGVERRTIAEMARRETETNAQVCGTWGFFGDFYTGMHDVRHSWWAGMADPDGVVSENSYPQNFSPGRRNVRHGSLGRSPNLPFARALPSEWPDGGHDADFDVPSFNRFTFPSTATETRPDHPNFISMALPAESDLAPMFVSNLGRFISETELGNVYDPLMWIGRENPSRDSIETWPYEDLDFAEVPQISEEAQPALHVGGGNTLRIGRPEHERFAPLNEIGQRASRLLDLFHCGIPLSDLPERREGSIQRIEGHLNINTAPREVIRAQAAGILATDRSIGREFSFRDRDEFAPRVSGRYQQISATDNFAEGARSLDEAGLIADAIIAGRPYVSRSQLADLRFPDDFPNEDLRGLPVFGNKLLHEPEERLQWTDRASEELFARVYNSSTVRSRNFRIHVIGQALEQTPSGSTRVKATRKKSYRVFANPGERNESTGEIQLENLQIETLYETNL